MDKANEAGLMPDMADVSLEKLAGLARLMNSLKSTGKAPEAENKNRPMTEMDLNIETPAIRTIKAAVPYVERRYRRSLGVMIKLIEIDKFLNEYKDLGAVTAESAPDNMAFLRAVVPGLPKENRKTGELLIRLLEIKQIAERKDI